MNAARPQPRLHSTFLRLLLLFLAISAGTLACAAPQATQEERQAFDEAVSPLPEDPGEGASRLEAFLRLHRESPLAEEAAYVRAQVALDSGDRNRAVFWLAWLVRNHPDGERSDATRIRLAKLYAQDGDDEMARSVLRDVRIGDLDADQKRVVYRLRADVSDDRAERLQWLAAARGAAAEARVSAAALELMDAEIEAAVDAMTMPELQRAWQLLEGRPPAGRVGLRLAQQSLDGGEYEEAGRDLRVAGSLALSDSDRSLLSELSMRMELQEEGRGEQELLPTFAEVAAHPVPPREGARGTLGVVLPLSGPYASYGEESLRGILLAAGIFAEASAATTAVERVAESGSAEPSGVRILVRDTAGDPARAAAAVRDLASHEDVKAIVGPLRSSTAEAAARAAEEAGIPLIALTTSERVSQERRFVFRLRTGPEDELRYLVDYAFRTLGARRFAILYPDDGYGRGMRDHFWRIVEEQGGWLVAAAAYEPGATDFGSAIREMVGYPLLTGSERGALEERDSFLRRGRRLSPRAAARAREIAHEMIGPEGLPLPPVVDFDALFVPDTYEQIGLLAPQLAFNDLTGVQLLGPSDWYHPDLIEIAREHVSGAVISALFDPQSRFAFVADFVNRYRQTFGTEPDAFSANAYDAANLVLVQLARGYETRDAVRQGVLRTQAYPGASGVTSLRPDGNARKRPFLMQIRGSSIVSLD